MPEQSRRGSAKLILIAIGAVVLGLILYQIYLWLIRFFILAVCIVVAGAWLWWKFGRKKKKPEE
jgi:undecaprenyl pyrophosphate phosphatase UppP